jgi:hypothetical protein
LEFGLQNLIDFSNYFTPGPKLRTGETLYWVLILHSLGWAWGSKSNLGNAPYRATRLTRLKILGNITDYEVPLDEAARGDFLLAERKLTSEQIENSSISPYFRSNLPCDIFESSALAAEYFASQYERAKTIVYPSFVPSAEWNSTGWLDIEINNDTQEIRRASNSTLVLKIPKYETFRLLCSIIQAKGEPFPNREANSLFGEQGNALSETVKSRINHYKNQLVEMGILIEHNKIKTAKGGYVAKRA